MSTLKRRHFLGILALSPCLPEIVLAAENTKPSLEILSRHPAIPEFRLTDINGDTHHPEQYLGKALLINFWATWCPPCLAEMASMDRLQKLLKGAPFGILAIAMNQTVDEITTYHKDTPLSFPLLADPDGLVTQSFGVNGLPTSFLCDHSGRQIFRARGGRQWDAPRMQRAISLLMP